MRKNMLFQLDALCWEGKKVLFFYRCQNLYIIKSDYKQRGPNILNMQLAFKTAAVHNSKSADIKGNE